MTLIIKPFEVWDTRSPFFYYNQQLRKLNRQYWSQIICSLELSNNIEGEINDLFKAKSRKKTRIGYIAWGQYKKSFEDDELGNKPEPTNENFKNDLRENIYVITQNSIVNLMSLFESFLQCWAMNYFLSKIENNVPLTKKENILNNQFLKNHPPSSNQIIHGVHLVKEYLESVLYPIEIENDINPKKEFNTYDLNGYKAITFWIKWRNTIIHKGGIANSNFITNHEALWSSLSRKFPYLPRINYGRLLSNSPNVFRSVATMNHQIVRKLRNELVDFSKGHRGHIFSPGEPRIGRIPFNEVPTDPPKMILNNNNKEYQLPDEYQSLETKEMKKAFIREYLTNKR